MWLKQTFSFRGDPGSVLGPHWSLTFSRGHMAARLVLRGSSAFGGYLGSKGVPAFYHNLNFVTVARMGHFKKVMVPPRGGVGGTPLVLVRVACALGAGVLVNQTLNAQCAPDINTYNELGRLQSRLAEEIELRDVGVLCVSLQSKTAPSDRADRGAEPVELDAAHTRLRSFLLSRGASFGALWGCFRSAPAHYVWEQFEAHNRSLNAATEAEQVTTLHTAMASMNTLCDMFVSHTAKEGQHTDLHRSDHGSHRSGSSHRSRLSMGRSPASVVGSEDPAEAPGRNAGSAQKLAADARAKAASPPVDTPPLVADGAVPSAGPGATLSAGNLGLLLAMQKTNVEALAEINTRKYSVQEALASVGVSGTQVPESKIPFPRVPSIAMLPAQLRPPPTAVSHIMARQKEGVSVVLSFPSGSQPIPECAVMPSNLGALLHIPQNRGKKFAPSMLEFRPHYYFPALHKFLLMFCFVFNVAGQPDSGHALFSPSEVSDYISHLMECETHFGCHKTAEYDRQLRTSIAEASTQWVYSSTNGEVEGKTFRQYIQYMLSGKDMRIYNQVLVSRPAVRQERQDGPGRESPGGKGGRKTSPHVGPPANRGQRDDGNKRPRGRQPNGPRNQTPGGQQDQGNESHRAKKRRLREEDKAAEAKPQGSPGNQGRQNAPTVRKT